VTADAQRLHVEGAGEVVDWAVKMRRLPDDATLDAVSARRGDRAQLEALGSEAGGFSHACCIGAADRGAGRLATVARNARENFAETVEARRRYRERRVYDRWRRSPKSISRASARSLMPSGAGVPRDTHGDLHLDHVYLFPDQAPPEEPRRHRLHRVCRAFPVCRSRGDMAFLAMDLIFHGRRDLARVFADAYFRAACDATVWRCCRFTPRTARGSVRAKVDGIELDEREVPADEKTRGASKRAGPLAG